VNRINGLGDRSLSFTHSLKLTPLQNDARKIFLFPKFSNKDINYKMSVSHSTRLEKVLQAFDHIESAILSVDDFINDFKGFVKTKTADELRAKIEERVRSNNSPFKGIKELKNLFERSASQHIDNLAKLLEICQKAEMIDMDYDLKFRLRYIISNVLLYGKNND
jgi:histidyl-tRNA synthetase